MASELFDIELADTGSISVSIFEQLSDDDIERLKSFYSSYYDIYSKSADDIANWGIVARAMLTGETKQDRDNRLDVNKDKKNIEYLSTKSEAPISSVIVDYKTAALSSISIAPDVISYDGKSDIPLNEAMSYLFNKKIDLYTKNKVIYDGETMGIGIIRMDTSDVTANMPITASDIKLSRINPSDLLMDYTKPIQEQNVILYRRMITTSDFSSFNPEYSKRYDEELDTENVLGNIEKDDKELEFLEIFIKDRSLGDFYKDRVLKIIVIDDVIVDVIQTPYILFPFAAYTPKTNENAYQNSSLYLLVDLNEQYNRMNVALFRILTFLIQPQYEVLGEQLQGNMKEHQLKLNLPGSIISTNAPNSIKTLDRYNDLAAIMNAQAMIKQAMYEMVGLNPMNMGQDSGNLRGSIAVEQMLNTSSKPLTAAVPQLSKFYEECANMLMFNTLFSTTSKKLKYSTGDEKAEKAVEELDLEQYKDAKLFNLDMSTTTNDVNYQVAQNQILTLLTSILQYTKEPSDETKQLNNILIENYIDLMQLDSVRRSKILSSVDSAIENTQQAREEGFAQGGQLATTMIKAALEGSNIIG